MNNCNLLFIVIIVILVNCNCISNLIIEGVENEEGEEHTTESVQDMSLDEFNEELERIKEENYSSAGGFEAMRVKGLCTDEPHTNDFHSCKIDNISETKQTLDLRYVNPGPRELNESTEYTYNVDCFTKYAKTMDILVGEPLASDETIYKSTLDPSIPDTSKFFTNRFTRGQYPGYTPNAYIHETRYIDSEEPLPVNPDFFVTNGGTYS